MEGEVALIGAGGHARSVRFCIESAGKYRLAGVVADDIERGSDWSGLPCLGPVRSIADILDEHAGLQLLVAIGDNHVRQLISDLVGTDSRTVFASGIHPRAVVAPTVVIGAGVTVMAGAVINPGCILGDGVIVNTGAVVDHDCTLEPFCSIGPGAALGGGVRIGRRAFVGIGATIIHGRTLGADTVLAAGSVATRDIDDLCVAAGVPARRVRGRERGERVL